MHDLPLITTIAASFFAAWLLGLITFRIGLSPIIGYLLAGILLGPHTPGFVGDVHLATQLAEVGVILLMFGVGLHFHLEDLYAVKWIAIPGALGQSAVATVLGVVVFQAFGFTLEAGLVLGMAMAVASTVVLIRVLQDNGQMETHAGHAAIGWLIVEDILTVVALVLLPILGAHAHGNGGAQGGFWEALVWAFIKLGALMVVVLLAGTWLVPKIMVRVARLRSRELFTLTVLVLSITIAAAAYSIFGASMALGAFLGGMVVGQTPVSHQAASDALPLRDAFAVLFFVSVGMLLEPEVLLHEPLMVLSALAIVLIAKPLAAIVIVVLLGRSFHTGLVIALGLAQIGEFSFILAELARKEGLMPASGHSVLVAAAIISIALNPVLYQLHGPLERRARRVPWLWRILNGRAERRMKDWNADTIAQLRGRDGSDGARTAIVVGYGFVGENLDRLLRDRALRSVIIDTNMDTIARLNEEDGRTAIFGDATRISVLEDAGVRDARYLFVTMAKTADPIPVISQARQLNPDIRIFVRSRYIGEHGALLQAGATEVVFEEVEAAFGMGRRLLRELGASSDEISVELKKIRQAAQGQYGEYGEYGEVAHAAE